jgi:hypothetical protein
MLGVLAPSEFDFDCLDDGVDAGCKHHVALFCRLRGCPGWATSAVPTVPN